MLLQILKALREAIGVGANLAGIIAAGFAVYAYFYPEVVSDYFARVSTDYLEQIDRNTSRSANSLDDINESSAATADATGEIADDLATWLRPEPIDPQRAQMFATVNALAGGSGLVIGIAIYNDTGFAFRDVDVVAKLNGEFLFNEKDLVIPPRESQPLIRPVDSFDEVNGEAELCIAATNDKNNSRELEYRRVIVQSTNLVTKAYERDDRAQVICGLLFSEGRDI